MTSQTTRLSATGPATSRPWWQLGLGAGPGAAIINLIMFYVYQVVTGAAIQVVRPTGGGIQDLAVVLVILLSILPPVLAGLLAIALTRWTRAASVWFTVISLVVLAVSLISPFGLPAEVPTGAKLTLAAMHVVGAGVTLAAFVPRLSAARA